MSIFISRILHAGYLFDDRETKIVFDPIFENPFSRNCFAFPAVRFDLEKIRNLKIDAIFISHHHDDHCSLTSLDLLDRKTPIFIYCHHNELFDLIRELGFADVRSLTINSPVTIGNFTVTPRLTLDAEVDSILQIRNANLNVMNVVDSMIDPGTIELFKSEAPWDLVLWPFQTMRETAVIAPSRFPPEAPLIPQEWIAELKCLNPKFVVPSSCQFIHEDWSWHNHALFPMTYEQFAREIYSALPGCKVIRMNPSETFELKPDSLTKVDLLSWVIPIGPQEVDYHYRPELPRPSTAEIATHFGPLSSEHTDRVLKFCQSEISAQHKSLEPAAYFALARLWRLSLFDDKGTEITFHYVIQGSEIRLASPEELHARPLAWTTEVPLAKVYAALEQGEALTSMYIRVNDFRFAPEIEEELVDFDVLEDPLIRTLFNGKFGAYQKAQLASLIGQIE